MHRLLVAGLTRQRLGFGPRPFHVIFMVERVGRLYSDYFCFPLSVSYHQQSILIFMFLLTEGQMANPGNISKSNGLSEQGEYCV